MERARAFHARAARHLDAEHGRLRNARDAVRAAGQAGQVVQQQADDFTKAERDDGQVVAAQPQHRETEHEAEQRRHARSNRQALPEREPEVLVEQRVRIAAHCVEAHVAQVEQAGEAHHDVQAQAQDHVDQGERGHVHRATRAEERPDQAHRQQHPDHHALLLRAHRRRGRQLHGATGPR
ncbi:hypothetical protein D3C81_1432810 [compost metagenome]